MTWIESLTVLHRLVAASCTLVISSPSLIQSYAPLRTLAPRMRRFPSLKRVMMVVICMVRWRTAVSCGLKNCGVVVVDFVSTAVEAVTLGLSDVYGGSRHGTIETRWSHLLCRLYDATQKVDRFARGVMIAIDGMKDTPYRYVFSSLITSILTYILSFIHNLSHPLNPPSQSTLPTTYPLNHVLFYPHPLCRQFHEI